MRRTLFLLEWLRYHSDAIKYLVHAMSEAATLELIEATLATRAMVAFESTDEGIRDNGYHDHSGGQLLGSASGLLSVTTRRGAWVVPATHCVWIPPRQVHAVRSHGQFSGWSLYINEATSASLSDAPRTMRTVPLLREAIHRHATLPFEPETPRHEHLARVILDELAHLPAEGLELIAPIDPRLVRITDAIIADFTTERSLLEWSKWAGISSRSLSRRFVVETGFTFTAWRQRARLIRALELLAQGFPVTTVSLDLGYESISAFITLFRRTYGLTPGEYSRAAGTVNAVP